MEHSVLYWNCYRLFNSKTVDIAWLKRAVVKGAIKEWEYKEICGEEYIA